MKANRSSMLYLQKSYFKSRYLLEMLSVHEGKKTFYAHFVILYSVKKN